MSKTGDYRVENVTNVEEIRALVMTRWGDTMLMGGRGWSCEQVRALKAVDKNGKVLGYIVWNILRTTALVFTLESYRPGSGIGSRLLDAVGDIARDLGAKTIRVMTTNDNAPALIYYQKRGFQMTAFFPGAVDIYRIVATRLPTTGYMGLPVRDAIELEKQL